MVIVIYVSWNVIRSSVNFAKEGRNSFFFLLFINKRRTKLISGIFWLHIVFVLVYDKL